jgi:Domain of unknown function (DUF5127)/Domain of unknown function (DUF4965)/Domain of unknown function (DUF1793)/Domain of unknown function (DUF4964)
MSPKEDGEGSEGGLQRRTFLKITGAVAAMAPGVALLGGLPDGLPDARGATARQAGAAAARTAATSAGTILLGGAPVRPPSVPLAVRSPYLSTWLPATDLTAANPQFWYGGTRGFTGLARIDGHTYWWAGKPAAGGTAATQTSLQVTATRSIFALTAAGVELTAEWLSPIEPGDLKRESAPLALLTVSVHATDGKGHDVQLYADVTGEWATSDETATITWQTTKTASNRYWSVELETQGPLTEYEQMAQWGTAIWGTPRSAKLTYQSGSASAVRSRFEAAGSLTDGSGPHAPATAQRVFAFARDLGAVHASQVATSFTIGHARTPLVSYGKSATPLPPLWTSHWPDWTAMADFFLADAGAARGRAATLDAKIETAATKAAGTGYSAICALASRQCYGGVELAIGPQGQPWLMGKEISSDGDVNTTDIFSQAYLMWLWLDPEIIPLEMEPILDWCASPGWQDASLWKNIPSWKDGKNRYCVHDLGVYPVAPGRAPGDGEQMPIDESAAMLIMAASYALKAGQATAKPFLEKWQVLWTQWAEYLLTQVPAPAKQLTTDDWVPAAYRYPEGGVNLGIKAIIGLAAAGQIAASLGDTANAAKWSKAAADNVQPWVTKSQNAPGGYLNWEEGDKGTWTTVYNAYYEQVIGEKLVPENVKKTQADFYATKLQTYGLPLQTGSPDISKVAWNVFIPAWLSDYPVAAEMLGRDVAYINDTPSLVPYGDRYNTTTAVEASGIKAHPTVGAVFALLAASDTIG